MQTHDNARFHIVLVNGWIENGGKFLLSQRALTELQRPGAWSLPGGKVEGGSEETDILQKTLRKEIEEEVGVAVADEMRFICDYSFIRVDGAHVVGLTFLCKYESGEARPLEDTASVKWLSLEELKSIKAEDFLKREIEELVKYLGKN
jgi:8-oxo-dGTP diphosphatase